MDFNKLTRDADYIKKHLHQSDGVIITKRSAIIIIPSRYADKDLAVLGDEVYILALYAIIMDDKYAVSKSLSMLKINPVAYERIDIDGMEYLKFEFDPGGTISDELDVVISDTLTYNIYDVSIDFGLIPVYLEYEEAIQLFNNTKETNGVVLGANRAVLELIISMIARDPKDKRRYLRQIIKTNADKKNIKPTYIAFKSIEFGPKTTTAMLLGANFKRGVNAALINDVDKNERIETLLRQ